MGETNGYQIITREVRALWSHTAASGLFIQRSNPSVTMEKSVLRTLVSLLDVIVKH